MKSNATCLPIILVAAIVSIVEAAHAFYDPGLQRWVNRDPLGDIASLPLTTATIKPNIEVEQNEVMTNDEFQDAWIRVNGNLYGAIGNSALNLIDPSGLDANSYANCIERYRNPITEQLPNAIAENLGSGGRMPGWVSPAAHGANAAANRAVGDTRRTGIGGKKPHPTTWQNKLGREIARDAGKPRIGQVGKWFGRATVALTIFEGFWDLGLLAGCGIAEAIPD